MPKMLKEANHLSLVQLSVFLGEKMASWTKVDAMTFCDLGELICSPFISQWGNAMESVEAEDLMTGWGAMVVD